MIKLVNSNESLKEAQSFIGLQFAKYKYIVIKIMSDKRSFDQNALQFDIYRHLEKQGDQTSAEYRRYCKYHFGLLIRAASDEYFARIMRVNLKAHVYEDRLLMMDFIDVTSTFSVKQMRVFINNVINHYENEGMDLTKYV